MDAKYSGIASREWLVPCHSGAAAHYLSGGGGDTVAPPPLASCAAQCRPGAGEAAVDLKVGCLERRGGLPQPGQLLLLARQPWGQRVPHLHGSAQAAKPWIVRCFDWEAAAAGCGDSVPHTCSSEQQRQQQRQPSRCGDQHTTGDGLAREAATPLHSTT